jgi:hypothetical protein
MRVPEEPVCVHLFRQNPVFTSLHLKSPVHVHRLWGAVGPLRLQLIFLLLTSGYWPPSGSWQSCCSWRFCYTVTQLLASPCFCNCPCYCWLSCDLWRSCCSYGVSDITITVADFPAFATVPVVASYPVALGVSATTVKDAGFPAFATVPVIAGVSISYIPALAGSACWSPC